MHEQFSRIKSESEKQLTEEEIFNSNNVDLLAQYAKTHRSKPAIDKVRELLEFSRKTGEEVVQNFLDALKECEDGKRDYTDFEKTEHGKRATALLEKIPEPFKTSALKKLEGYKKELTKNTALFKKHKENPEGIWKDVFGFDYHTVPEFKERFKTFFFKDTRALFKDYYKGYALEANQDPFAINFFVDNPENFNKVYPDLEDAHTKVSGFSINKKQATTNVINNSIADNPARVVSHESEHVIHRNANPFTTFLSEDPSLESGMDFEFSKDRLNYALKFDFEERLKEATDEIFSFLKDGTNKEDAEAYLIDRNAYPGYDFNKAIRDTNSVIINDNPHFSETEKQQLMNGIHFLQSEYDRVLKNMIGVMYEKNYSVEFFRNVPINELWKYSNGMYQRTDFIIRDFKF